MRRRGNAVEGQPERHASHRTQIRNGSRVAARKKSPSQPGHRGDRKGVRQMGKGAEKRNAAGLRERLGGGRDE